MSKGTQWKHYVIQLKDQEMYLTQPRVGGDLQFWSSRVDDACRFVTRSEAEAVLGGFPEIFKNHLEVVEVPFLLARIRRA